MTNFLDLSITKSDILNAVSSGVRDAFLHILLDNTVIATTGDRVYEAIERAARDAFGKVKVTTDE